MTRLVFSFVAQVVRAHFARFSPRATAHRFSLEIGRCSSIHTMSPTEYSFFSSWAWYFFDRRTVFFMTGCVKRRSTRTTTVLFCLSLTTVPCSIRFGILASLLRLWLRRALLLRDRLDARDVASDRTHARCIFELSGRPLEAEIELLLLELEHLVVELIDSHRPKIFRLRHRHYSAIRSTKRVLIGSFAAASASASFASCSGTPSSSNMMRPGLTRHTQNSGAPLPEPMRTSSGFFETGTSG